MPYALILFVHQADVPESLQNMDTITPVARYVETNLHRMSTNALADGDMLNLLGGEGGVQVDVVFYMVSNSKWQGGKIYTEYKLAVY